MNGKRKCRILKDIRRKIAQENDIEYVTSECKYQGDCTGTCPKCEAELRYLEQELEKRQKAGKVIAVAGIAATLVVGSTGCSLDDLFASSTQGAPLMPETSQATTTEPSDELPFMGEMPVTDPIDKPLAGVPVMPDPTEEFLMGDVPLWPEP